MMMMMMMMMMIMMMMMMMTMMIMMMMSLFSLTGVVRLLFGKSLDKSQQRSNWDLRPLRPAQRKYAALDAFVLLIVYDEIRRRIRVGMGKKVRLGEGDGWGKRKGVLRISGKVGRGERKLSVKEY